MPGCDMGLRGDSASPTHDRRADAGVAIAGPSLAFLVAFAPFAADAISCSSCRSPV